MDTEQINKLIAAIDGLSERLDHLIVLNGERVDTQANLVKLLKARLIKNKKG